MFYSIIICVLSYSVNRYRQTLLHIAASGGHVEMIKMLIDAKADATALDIDNRTPLHLAARNGRVEAVECLMQIICDLKENKMKYAENKDDNEDYTSYLDEAILNGQR